MNIRRITDADLPAVQGFIHRFFKPNHVLCRSVELFRFLYLGPEGYTFYLAEEDGRIAGVKGVISISTYDPSVQGVGWRSIWARDSDDRFRGVGEVLFLHVSRQEGYSLCSTIGAGALGLKIAHKLGHTIGYMHNYYIANQSITDFRLCISPRFRHDNTAPISIGWDLRPIDFLNPSAPLPPPCYGDYRTHRYMASRYARHPMYRYQFYALTCCGQIRAVWVVRQVEHCGHSALLIVDLLGSLEDLPPLYCLWQKVLRQTNAEYVCMPNYGIQPDVFTRLGFQHIDPEQGAETIVPIYFEPFEQRNPTIWLFHDHRTPLVAFKGDSDQDRPSIL